MIKGPVVYLAVSALNNSLEADSRFRTCKMDIEYCEILASTTEMLSSAANLGTCSGIFCCCYVGIQSFPGASKLLVLFLKVQLCQTSTVYRLKLFVMGIRFKSLGISVKIIFFLT